uniref:SMB domain-containing protein n=1 Tax=Steinernema glaseri TaxID=37863 RepID=A0A1I8AE08_9BILA
MMMEVEGVSFCGSLPCGTCDSCARSQCGYYENLCLASWSMGSDAFTHATRGMYIVFTLASSVASVKNVTPILKCSTAGPPTSHQMFIYSLQ